jgi:5-methylcytosine-specific restriction endonuclease McrA
VTVFELSAVCECGCEHGYTVDRDNHIGLYCQNCDKWQKWISRLEAGRKPRTLSTREGVTPSQRARILDRHDHACIGCGKRPPEVRLELEHIISRELAAEHGMLDDLIDSEWNLAPMCPECNSGHRWLHRASVRLMYRCLQLAQRSAPP